ncbi:MAG: T9SS type A sorting domain-containing protein [Candidatus Margulisbacteria bacterium]|nr:T9SS type A sorting domain-containing protein [Candidatus Margulisiibacteriota bacterium]
MSMSWISRRVLAFLVLFFCFSLVSEAAITVSLSSGKSRIPLGVNAEVMRMAVSATGSAEVLSQVILENLSETVRFGKGISRVRIFSSLNSQFDSSSISIGEQTFTSAVFNEVTVSLTQQTIAAGGSAVYFIVYDVDSSATLILNDSATTTNVHVTSITTSGGSSADLSAQASSNTVIISGVRTLSVSNIAPAIVLPGQTKVPMLKFSIAVSGEGINDNLTMRIVNAAGTFVTTANSKKGVTRAYLYYFPNSTSSFDTSNPDESRLVKTLTPTTFTSSSEIVFDSSIFGKSSDFSAFAEGKTSPNIDTFYLFYDVGEDFDISTQTTIQAQLTGFSGDGASSGLKLNGSSLLPLPSDPAECLVSGLTFNSLTNIVPSTHTFGPGTVVPMLRIALRANHADITVNRMIIENKGTFPFVTDPTSTRGIKNIRIFEDTNGDAEFDGENSGDTLISTLALGNGNTASKAELLLNTTSGVSLKTFNTSSSIFYPANKEKVLFVVYDIGEGSLTSLTTVSANAFLSGAVGKATVSGLTVTMNLLGTLPSSSAPVASVKLVKTNLSIISVEDISPTFAVRGQRKVPMLYVQINGILESGESIPSATVQIVNETNTYLTNNKGVSKVWLYRDEGDSPNKKLDTTDTLLGSFSIGGGSAGLVSLDKVSLNGIPFVNGTQYLMLFYDLGQIAKISTNDMRAQLNNISSDGNGTTVILGGETPVPKEPASVAVLDHYMKVLTVTSGSDLTATFSGTIRVENISSRDVSLVSLYPGFYLGSIAGRDISNEFTHKITSVVNFPVTVNAGDQLTINFDARHSTAISQGSGVIDGIATYVVSSNFQAMEMRYLNTSWFSAADTVANILLASSGERYPWQFPSYISSIAVVSGGTSVTFNAGNALQPGSQMKITFKKLGAYIDDGSLQLTLNGSPLLRASTLGDLEAGKYSYNQSTGVLTIQDLGSQNGALVLKVRDLDGFALEDLSVSFLISPSRVQVSDLLFYPNPFHIGSESLRLGFNLTRASNIKLYIYNFQGRQVFSSDQEVSSVGYNTITFDSLSGFLKSGMYICRLVAKDTDGFKSIVTTRLAVF